MSNGSDGKLEFNAIEIVKLMIDINKTLVMISKTQEVTNASLESLINLNEKQGCNIETINEQIKILKAQHDGSMKELSELKTQVDSLNKRFTSLNLQLDFKERQQREDEKEAEAEEQKKADEARKFKLSNALSALWGFIKDNFQWIVILIAIILIALGVISGEQIAKILVQNS